MKQSDGGGDVTCRPPESTSSGVRESELRHSPREARRHRRIELSRQQILDTAEELFAERGYYDTGLKDVAARCEFSVGSIYTFFESKELLYEQVLMRRSIAIETLKSLVPETLDADVRLVELARIWIDHAAAYPQWGALTAEISRIARSPGAAVPDAWIHSGERTQKFLVDVIEKGQSQGTLRAGSSSSLGQLFYAVVTSFIVVTSMGRMNGVDQPNDAQEFLEFVRDTFSTRPSFDLGRVDLD
ncbi:TetR/AcrR family transcriptional regulator [Rhodococcus fascians]|nr:TetR/AcrR family transcriptional regulator [Rhodococcus fascians]MBY4140925.1 TetR/AcrR family transcriptional regulator [Rhodococcus fascians]MBY4219589.1 TetR/AcrR family transcriptional regulator [Rhodococcus fascians]MBY4221898.1 TetR/AcrR family transcriptional regulator [Rhodococcus fascians]MBY4233899.1 TetR/AcrR family transcriptional regulator [Rhodococcus fascians]